MSEVKVAASVLAADPLRLGEDIARAKEAGADLLHLDIMDGHFVPNLTLGVDVVKKLKGCGLPLDVHLMVNCLDWAVPTFAPLADYLTVHAEATGHLHKVLKDIKRLGAKAGLAFNPATPPDVLPYVADLLDLVLVMTVNPGFGGQSLIPSALDKVPAIRKVLWGKGLSPDIQVDGGVTGENARMVKDKGATILVSGTYIFKAPDMKLAISSLK